MNEQEQRLFNNFGHSVMNEEVARVLQAKEELDYHRKHTEGESETLFWENEVERLTTRLINCVNCYVKNNWSVFIETFSNRNESNYSALGYFAKMYKFMFNNELPFDED